MEDTAGLLEPDSLKCCWSIELLWNAGHGKFSDAGVEISKNGFFAASSTSVFTAKTGSSRIANSILYHYYTNTFLVQAVAGTRFLSVTTRFAQISASSPGV